MTAELSLPQRKSDWRVRCDSHASFVELVTMQRSNDAHQRVMLGHRSALTPSRSIRDACTDRPERARSKRCSVFQAEALVAELTRVMAA
jgi:hypothetical protein